LGYFCSSLIIERSQLLIFKVFRYRFILIYSLKQQHFYGNFECIENSISIEAFRKVFKIFLNIQFNNEKKLLETEFEILSFRQKI
jgi:hypothetical protein